MSFFKDLYDGVKAGAFFLQSNPALLQLSILFSSFALASAASPAELAGDCREFEYVLNAWLDCYGAVFSPHEGTRLGDINECRHAGQLFADMGKTAEGQFCQSLIPAPEMIHKQP